MTAGTHLSPGTAVPTPRSPFTAASPPARTAAPPLHFRSGTKRYTLRRVAEGVDGTVLEHRTQPGRTLPDYGVRRDLVRTIALRTPAAVVVFVHRLHPPEVWGWVERRTGAPGQYREQWVVDEQSRSMLHSRLRQTVASRSASNAEPQPDLAAALGAALLRRARSAAVRMRLPRRDLRSVDGPGFGALGRIQQRIEGSDDPAVVRAFWRALRETTLLDPRCASGDRLIGALEVLVVLYDACLERMRAWVAELACPGVPHRRDRHADFRRVLRRALDTRYHPTPTHYLVRSILRHNLYGAEPDAALIGECEHRLLAAAGPASARASGSVSGPAVGTSLNVRHGDVTAGFASLDEVRSSLRDLPGADEVIRQLAEAAETIYRTDRLLREAAEREETGQPPDAADSEALAQRVAILRQRLDALRARDTGIDPDDRGSVARWIAERRPVHLCAEFPAVMQAGGFDLVLEHRTPVWDPDRGGRVSPPEFRHRGSDTRRAREPHTPFPAPGPAGPRPMAIPGTRVLEADDRDYPAALRTRLREDAPVRIFVRGDRSLLELPLLAVFCSVRVPGRIILRSLDAARELRDRGVPTVGGFQSPLERECLVFLLKGTQPVVVSPARRIEPMRLSLPWRTALDERRLLLVSRFGERFRRPTARMAEARNRLVGALADRVLIAHATPGGRLTRLTRQLVDWQLPVYTWDDACNEDLVRLGARAVTRVAECLVP